MKDNQLRSVTNLEKSGRVHYYAANTNPDLLTARWNAIRFVNVSNKAGLLRVQTAKRLSRLHGREVHVRQSFLIEHYYQTVDGSDQTDRNQRQPQQEPCSNPQRKVVVASFSSYADIRICPNSKAGICTDYLSPETPPPPLQDILEMQDSIARVYSPRPDVCSLSF